MKLVITIELDNAAFEDNVRGEVKRILSRIVLALPNTPELWEMSLRDINGNRVGNADIEK